jgi:hypothetical protein
MDLAGGCDAAKAGGAACALSAIGFLVFLQPGQRKTCAARIKLDLNQSKDKVVERHSFSLSFSLPVLLLVCPK